MRAVLIIMPCSLAGMKMGKPGTLFFVGFMIPEKKSFKIEQAGSEKAYAFCVPPQKESKRVAVYEACIDALAI